nr:MBL fold metallo-hydrolase [Sphingomicrobium nitratireducens]
MSVTLVSHSSVIIAAGETRILCDPWQFGTAFNDSWKLLIDPMPLDEVLDTIDYLWISHEHPDHFHIPTLRSLPDAFKQRVIVLFQRSSDHAKMEQALMGMLGFRTVKLLDHRKWTRLDDACEVYCFHSRQLDSALAVRHAGQVVLNLNDTEASERDTAAIRSDIGNPGVLLNQFSYAGFEGFPDRLERDARTILDKMVDDHRRLGAGITVPFASFVYFCREDNRRLNAHANSPRMVKERFSREGLQAAALRPGDTLAIGGVVDDGDALAHYDAIYAGLDSLEILPDQPVDWATLQTGFGKFVERLRHYHGWATRALRPVTIHIADLGRTVRMDCRRAMFEETDAAPDLTINSQPLSFVFATPFGLQTLGVSGRYTVHHPAAHKAWFRLRALSAAINADVGLSLRKALRPSQLGWFWQRRRDIVQQLAHRVRRAFE